MGRAIALALVGVTAIVTAGCRDVLSREYEYEEDVRLALDGSATVFVNASVPALVALRGADLPLDPRARLDRGDVERFFDTPASRVIRVSTSRRDNRRYVHVRIEVDDIRRLGAVAPFAWSRYAFDERDGLLVFTQEMGESAARDVGSVGWSGSELMAVRLHLPSRVPFHNQPSGTIDRGNIIAWEQPLTARLAGEPLRIEVHMETQSILRDTLTLFAFIIGLVALMFVAVIWYVMRRTPALGSGLPPAAPGPSASR